jgi:hypothetical protein
MRPGVAWTKGGSDHGQIHTGRTLRHRGGTRNSSNLLGLNITIRSVGQEIVKAGRITFFRSDFAESPSSAEVLTKLSGRKIGDCCNLCARFG